MQLGELLAEGRDSPLLSKEQRREELDLHARRRVQSLPEEAVQQRARLLAAACSIGLQCPIVERGTRGGCGCGRHGGEGCKGRSRRETLDEAAVVAAQLGAALTTQELREQAAGGGIVARGHG